MKCLCSCMQLVKPICWSTRGVRKTKSLETYTSILLKSWALMCFENSCNNVTIASTGLCSTVRPDISWMFAHMLCYVFLQWSMYSYLKVVLNMKEIFVVMNTTWAVVKIRPEKYSGLQRSLSYSRLYLQVTYTTFIYSQLSIHHFMGLFETSMMTSSQLAC